MIDEGNWWDGFYKWITSFFSTNEGTVDLVAMFAACLFGIFMVIAIISLIVSAFGSRSDN